MLSVVVAIGRTVGTSSRPLPAAEWTSFRTSVREAVARAGAVFFFGDGLGIYEGQVEESHVVVGVAWGDDAVDGLRTALDAMVSTFQQEAIALITGEVEFRHD